MPTYENGNWRMKINQELYDKIKSPDIINVINLLKATDYVMPQQV